MLIKMAEDNLTVEPSELDLILLKEYQEKGKLQKPFFPLMTYDMVQCGYPLPTHGEMIPRVPSGTNEMGELIEGQGMWCKVEDVKKYLSEKGISISI